MDSLVYWHRNMGVDGFRFDLAPVLGRTLLGFNPPIRFYNKSMTIRAWQAPG